jgi:hypothetical protein
MQRDIDAFAPSEFASFQKALGAANRMEIGDEYVVRMPGPWDGPVRVVEVTPTSFRLATLEGHLEAGEIEFRVTEGVPTVFEIESWARSGDRLSDLLFDHARISKEVQLHMWTSVLERVIEASGGRREGCLEVETVVWRFIGRPSGWLRAPASARPWLLSLMLRSTSIGPHAATARGMSTSAGSRCRPSRRASRRPRAVGRSRGG